MLKPLNTRTSPSPSGTSAVKIKFVHFGAIIIKIRKGLFLLLIQMTLTVSMPRAMRCTGCWMRTSYVTQYCWYLRTSKICQMRWALLKWRINLDCTAFAPPTVSGIFRHAAPPLEMVCTKVSTGFLLRWWRGSEWVVWHGVKEAVMVLHHIGLNHSNGIVM